MQWEPPLKGGIGATGLSVLGVASSPGRGAISKDLGDDLFANSGDADGGVQEGGVAVVL
jgi:hypothetical protein